MYNSVVPLVNHMFSRDFHCIHVTLSSYRGPFDCPRLITVKSHEVTSYAET